MTRQTTKKPKTTRGKPKSIDVAQEPQGVTDKEIATKAKTGKAKNPIAVKEDENDDGHDDKHKPVRKMPRRAAAVYQHNYSENPADNVETNPIGLPPGIEAQSPAAVPPKKAPPRGRGKRLVSTDVSSTPTRQQPATETVAEKRGRKPKVVEVVANAGTEPNSDEPESHAETVAEKPKRGRKLKAAEIAAELNSDEQESQAEPVVAKPKRGRKPKVAPVEAEATHSSDEPENQAQEESPKQSEAKRTVGRRKAAATDSPAVPAKRGRRKAVEEVDEATPTKASGRGRKVVRFEQAPEEGVAKRVRK